MQYTRVIVSSAARSYPHGMAIADTLKRLMTERGVTGYALSEATKIPQPTIHRILTGESADPKTKTLEPIARYFGLTVSAMRDDKTPKNPPVQVGNEISTTPNIGLSGSVLNDPAVANLVKLFLQMGKSNRHRTLLECQLRVLDESPQSADPFEAIGLTNLLTREGSDDGSQGIAVSPAEAERRRNQDIGGVVKSRKK